MTRRVERERRERGEEKKKNESERSSSSEERRGRYSCALLFVLEFKVKRRGCLS